MKLFYKKHSNKMNLFYSLCKMATAAIIAIPANLSAQNHDGDHSGGGENFQHLECNTVGFIKANQNVSSDELGAIDTFKECYPHSSFSTGEEGGYGFENDRNNIVTCSEFSAKWAKDNNIKAIWIHINRPGVAIGWQNLPDGFADETFIRELRDWSLHGGNLYLSGLATQLLAAIGRQPSDLAPNIYFTQPDGQKISGGFDKELPDDDPWGVTGRLNGVDHDGITSFGHAKHAIYGQPDPNYPGYYAALTPKEGSDGEQTSITVDGFGDVPYKWNILGAEEGKTINVSDNNCMWDGNALGISREQFRRRNNCQIPGSWGQERYDTMNWGIVEFLPDEVDGISGGHDRFGTEEDPWKGNTIANGMACFQYANKDENKYYDNLRNMTFNTINYLSGEQRTVSSIELPGTDGSHPGEAVYYNLQGIRIENPASGGIYIKVQGSISSKVMFR